MREKSCEEFRKYFKKILNRSNNLEKKEIELDLKTNNGKINNHSNILLPWTLNPLLLIILFNQNLSPSDKGQMFPGGGIFHTFDH